MKRAFKVMMWAVLGLLVVLLLLAAAWIACNGRWADAAPQPVPSELQPQAVTLAPADNAFFDGQGLRAPEGESANAWGQRAWQEEPGKDAVFAVIPSGDEWACRVGETDCLARWRGASVALGMQMNGTSTFGDRCRALAARTAYQEPVSMRRARGDGTSLMPVVPHFRPLTDCLRWFHIEAVLAPDAKRAEAAWARADALLRLFASGQQTLIGYAIAWRWVELHQQLLAQWSAEQPAGHVLPAAWLAPMPERLLKPHLWMAAESQYQRETVIDLGNSGERMYDMDPSAVQAWAGQHSLGFLPQLTLQRSDERWMADMRLYGVLQGVALARAVREKPEQSGSSWRYVSWRNTAGHLIMTVAEPHFERYVLRQADLALYQAALELSQQLNAVPAADRAAWWARQPLDAGIRERLSLDGDALLVRGWRGDAEPDHKAPVRFPLRPA